MPTILQGRRANQYFGLAKNLLDGLKRARLKFVSRVIELPGGRALAQDNMAGGLIHIDVRDPYCAIVIRQRTDAGTAIYPKHYGGLTGEPFMPELPFVSVADSYTATADIQAVGNHTGMDLHGVGDFILPATVTFGTESTQSLLKVGMVFGVTNWQLGVNSVIPVLYTVHCNPEGEPLVEMATLGEFSEGMVVVVGTQRIEPVDGEVYDVIRRISGPETLPVPDLIWPPATLNSDRPDLARIASYLGCYARGCFLFVETYIDDWRDTSDPLPAPRLPDIIRITDFGAVSEITPILTAMPALSAFVTDDRLTLGDDTAFAFSGAGHITCIVDVGTESVLFTSADSGVTWANVAWPAGSAKVFAPLFNFSPLYSMQIGHVEFLDSAGHLWTSMDHGATWTSTNVFPAEWSGRGRGTATPLAVDVDGNVTKYVRLTIKSGDTNTTKLIVHRNLSLSDVLYEFDLPTGDRQSLSGELVRDPSLAVLGSPQFPIPIMPGHPGVLEYA